jgi:PKD repeat protein
MGIALAALLWPSGCASDKVREAGTPAGPETVAHDAAMQHGTALPALPVDRQADFIIGMKLQGNEFSSAENTVAEESTLLLQPQAGSIAWAVYQFQLGSDNPLYIDLDFTLPDPTDPDSGAYIGLGDYSNGSWELFGPYGGRQVLELDGQKHVSPGNMLAVAVIIEAPLTARLSQIELLTDHYNSPPLAILEADVVLGDAPLQVNFNASGSSDADGNISRYLWDFNGNGIYEQSSGSPLASYTYGDAGIKAVGVVVEDADGARSLAKLYIDVNVPGNNRPVAELNGTPLSGDAPLTIEFFGGGSRDQGGEIVRYDWDFDGDGDWDSYDGPEDLDHNYPEPGVFKPKILVTDTVGAQDLAEVEVKVLGLSEPVLVYADSWYYCATSSLAVIAGHPAIAASTGDALWLYMRANDAAGLNWPMAGEQDPGVPGEVDQIELLEIAGKPAVAMYTFILSMQAVSWRYGLAKDALGSEWHQCETITYGDWTYSLFSFSVVNGYPAIVLSDYEFHNSGLWFLSPLSNEPNSAIWEVQTLGRIVPVKTGITPSLCEVQGCPACVFTFNDTLLYSRAESAEGNTWPDTLETLDGPACDSFNDLQIVTGVPAVAYYRGGNELCYARSLDETGTDWQEPILVDSFDAFNDDVMAWPIQLVVINGRPALTYHSRDGVKGYLNYTHADDPAGASWPTNEVKISEDARWSSLAEVNGGFGISYCSMAGDVYYISGQY